MRIKKKRKGNREIEKKSKNKDFEIMIDVKIDSDSVIQFSGKFYFD